MAIELISSTGIDPIPGYGAYGMAKGQLWLLTRYMAAEWGAAASAPMLKCTALGRFGANADVIGAAVHLASDESAFTTGQCIHIDGGRT